MVIRSIFIMPSTRAATMNINQPVFRALHLKAEKDIKTSVTKHSCDKMH